MSEDDDAAASHPFANVPSPLSFVGIASTAAKLYGRKPLQLIGAFTLVFAAALLFGLAAGYFEGALATLAVVVARILIAIVATYATAFSALLLSDVIADRASPRGSILATLRVHTTALFTAALLATLFGLILDRLFPYLSLAIVGPPVVVHAIVLEYRTFPEALRRTRELLVGQSGRFLLYVFGFGLITVIIVISSRGFGLPLVAPFFTAAMLALYLDLRARIEELDPEAFAIEREEAMGERSVTNPTQG